MRVPENETPCLALTINIDGKTVSAHDGETVLSTLFAENIRCISKNDSGIVSGAYCGMGVCYCCTVEIDGVGKKRACKTLVKHGMVVKTCRNQNHAEDESSES